MVDRGPNFQSGARLVGPYQKVRKLGEGGMAETYLCVRREPGEPGDPRTRQPTIEDRICCKQLRPSARPADLAREVAIIGSLRHSNIVQLRFWDLVARELYCELIDGCDLRQLVTVVDRGKLSAPLVALIGIELCKALGYAHARTSKGAPAGIVHRDISPSNIMISYAGEVKLTDFGLAVVVALEQRAGEPLSGVVRGKLPYMAPEQARGDKFADHRVDIFSLGVVLYELLAGRRPAVGSDNDIYAALSTGQHARLHDFAPDVPEQLERVVERALHPNPAHRYQDADSMLDALAELAPPHNLFRKLGELAKRAQPPETVTYTPFHVAELPDEDVAGDALTDHDLPIQLSERAPSTAFVAPVDDTPQSLHKLAADHPIDEVPDSAAIEPIKPAPSAVLANDDRALPQPVKAKTRAKTRWISGAAALSISAVVLLLGAELGGATKQDGRPKTSLASGTPAALPLELAATKQQPTPPEPAPLAMQTADGAQQHQDDQASPPAPPVGGEDAARQIEPVELANASLRVGVVPIAQVWVNNRYLGWSNKPIAVKLAPDVDHVVAAGENKAEISRTVRLAPGEHRAITLRLPK